ncbi:hypothetical protein WP50_35770 [Lactiplantibacillus plantarum]|nr:hypothetical protein WP50_35770 [Lactiplantibacillus plantarum]
MDGDQVERKVLYSILDKWPKRADVYWFVNVTITDEPYTAEYTVDTLATDYLVTVKLYLGFRVRQDINRYLRTIVRDLMATGRLAAQKQTYSVTSGRDVGDFRFVIIEEKLENGSRLSRFVNVTITDEPYTAEYTVDTLATDYLVTVKLYLGFRVRQDINRYLRTIVRDLMATGRLAAQKQTYSVTSGRDVGDFRRQ